MLRVKSLWQRQHFPIMGRWYRDGRLLAQQSGACQSHIKDEGSYTDSLIGRTSRHELLMPSATARNRTWDTLSSEGAVFQSVRLLGASIIGAICPLFTASRSKGTTECNRQDSNLHASKWHSNAPCAQLHRRQIFPRCHRGEPPVVQTHEGLWPPFLALPVCCQGGERDLQICYGAGGAADGHSTLQATCPVQSVSFRWPPIAWSTSFVLCISRLRSSTT